MFHKRMLYLLALLLAATALFGQATTSTLVGTVTNDGKPLPGVTVTVIDSATLLTFRSASTRLVSASFSVALCVTVCNPSSSKVTE